MVILWLCLPPATTPHTRATWAPNSVKQTLVDGWLWVSIYCVVPPSGRDWDPRTASRYFQTVPEEVIELILTLSPYDCLPCGWQVENLAFAYTPLMARHVVLDPSWALPSWFLLNI